MENKVRASTEFFIAACKAGPWVPDKVRDRTLSKQLFLIKTHVNENNVLNLYFYRKFVSKFMFSLL